MLFKYHSGGSLNVSELADPSTSWEKMDLCRISAEVCDPLPLFKVRLRPGNRIN